MTCLVTLTRPAEEKTGAASPPIRRSLCHQVVGWVATVLLVYLGGGWELRLAEQSARNVGEPGSCAPAPPRLGFLLAAEVDGRSRAGLTLEVPR
jgi:hypothetical protein